MTVLRKTVLALALHGCAAGTKGDTARGTAVGNPGTVQLQTAKSSAIDLDAVQVATATVTVTTASGEQITLGEAGRALDWLNGGLEVPAGEYTGILLDFNANLTMTGHRTGDADTSFDMELLVRGIELNSATGQTVVIDGNDVAIELGTTDFLDPVDAVLLEGRHIIIEDERTRSSAEDTLRNETTAGPDDDGDRRPDRPVLRGS
jgi:hypothetical protein